MKLTTIAATVLAALALAGCAGNPAADETVTFEVTSKERGSGSGAEKQPTLVWGVLEDGTRETFKIEDSLWEGDVSSSDTYGMLVAGDKFTCTANGYRSEFFSEWRNLTNCKRAD